MYPLISRRALTHRLLVLLIASLASGTGAQAVEMQYRGTLYAKGEPANGAHTLRVTPYLTPVGGVPLAVPFVVHALDVEQGAFEARLDFGSALAAYDTVWLDVEVANAQGGFHRLPARQSAATKAVAACWSTAGNTGTDGNSDFIGTIDDVPLQLRVGNSPVAQFLPSTLG